MDYFIEPKATEKVSFFLNRLMVMPTYEQEMLFTFFSSTLDAVKQVCSPASLSPMVLHGSALLQGSGALFGVHLFQEAESKQGKTQKSSVVSINGADLHEDSQHCPTPVAPRLQQTPMMAVAFQQSHEARIICQLCCIHYFCKYLPSQHPMLETFLLMRLRASAEGKSAIISHG